MKAKYKRYLYLCLALLSISLGVVFVLSALKENIVFFYSPSELAARTLDPQQHLRVGGLVVAGSVRKQGDTLVFDVTDTAQTVTITYRGVVPNLFREGQGVVAEGTFRNGVVEASTLLAKHDENYMPPEVADAIRKSGHWKEPPK